MHAVSSKAHMNYDWFRTNWCVASDLLADAIPLIRARCVDCICEKDARLWFDGSSWASTVLFYCTLLGGLFGLCGTARCQPRARPLMFGTLYTKNCCILIVCRWFHAPIDLKNLLEHRIYHCFRSSKMAIVLYHFFNMKNNILSFSKNQVVSISKSKLYFVTEAAFLRNNRPNDLDQINIWNAPSWAIPAENIKPHHSASCWRPAAIWHDRHLLPHVQCRFNSTSANVRSLARRDMCYYLY